MDRICCDRMRLVQLFGPDPSNLEPIGIAYGDVVYLSNLTGEGDSAASAMSQALSRMQATLADADVALDGVARATAYVRHPAQRDPVYEPWDALFPDKTDRPAFKVLLAELPEGVTLRLDVLALRGGRRERIDLPGVPARDPTVRVGDWVLTSRVHGSDPATGAIIGGGAEAEARQAVSNVRQLVGGAPVNNLLVFARDTQHADVGQAAAAELGPSTQVINFVGPTMTSMLEAMAGVPRVREVYLDGSASPIPEAVEIEDLVWAPALAPIASHGSFTADLLAALERMDAVLKAAGLLRADVAHVTVYMPDIDLKPQLNDAWTEWFPDPNARPPHKYVPIEMSSGPRARVMVLAVRNGRRRILQIPGLVHGDPMSMGARIGKLVFSSRIVGTDTASGRTPNGPEAQAPLAVANVLSLLEAAGAAPTHVSQVTAFVTDDRDRQATLAACEGIFPAADLQFLSAQLPGSTTVRLEIVASLED